MMDHLHCVWLAVWSEWRRGSHRPDPHLGGHVRQAGLAHLARDGRDFMMPCYDRIAEFARRIGVRVISVDTDGDCASSCRIMMRHGVKLFLPFEVQAGNDILDYRRKYPTLGIMGGLDKRALAARVPISTARSRRPARWSNTAATSPASTTSSRRTCRGKATSTRRCNSGTSATEDRDARSPAAEPPHPHAFQTSLASATPVSSTTSAPPGPTSVALGS